MSQNTAYTERSTIVYIVLPVSNLPLLYLPFKYHIDPFRSAEVPLVSSVHYVLRYDMIADAFVVLT